MPIGSLILGHAASIGQLTSVCNGSLADIGDAVRFPKDGTALGLNYLRNLVREEQVHSRSLDAWRYIRCYVLIVIAEILTPSDVEYNQ